jgi:protein-S-isoprenylcysteine O-methyltransferase Ste14
MMIIILSWSLFFAFHSLLATNEVKAKCRKYFPSLYQYYRLLYNIVAILWLVCLLLAQLPAQQLLQATYFQHPVLRSVGIAVLLCGIWVGIKAFGKYDMAEFIGTRQLQQNPVTQAPQHEILQTNGWNSVVRHPLYFGTILLIIGTFLALPNPHTLAFLLSIIFYLPFGIYFEEKKLIKQFGNSYLLYRKKVKCLIPYII